MKRVLIVSKDAGGTSSLVPVVQQMLERGAEIRILASGPAIRVWEQVSIPTECQRIDDLVSDTDARDMIKSFQPWVVVTGAGAYNLIEHTFRRAAYALNVFCIALVDLWENYHKRFERKLNGRTESSIPDMVGVLDETCFVDMVEAGFDPNRLRIVGAPHLEVAARFVRESSRTEIAAWQSELGLSPESPILVFFSQPVETKTNKPIPQTISDTTTVRQIVTSLAQASVSSGIPSQLVVKAHPMETSKSLKAAGADINSEDIDLRIIETYDARKLICVADAVFGMTSTALLEAGLGGKPTYSIQIGEKRSGPMDSFYSTHTGITTQVYDTSKLDRIMSDLLDSAPSSRGVFREAIFRGSTTRTADMILSHGDTLDVPESSNTGNPL